MRTKKLLAIVTVLTMIATMLSGLTVSAEIVTRTLSIPGTDGCLDGTIDGFTLTTDPGTLGIKYAETWTPCFPNAAEAGMTHMMTTATVENCADATGHVHPSYTITAPAGATITSYSVVSTIYWNTPVTTCGDITWQAHVPNVYTTAEQVSEGVYTYNTTPVSEGISKTQLRYLDASHPAYCTGNNGSNGSMNDAIHMSNYITYEGLNTTSIKVLMPPKTNSSNDTKQTAVAFHTITYQVEETVANAGLKDNCLPAGGNKLAIQFSEAVNAIDAKNVKVASSKGEAVDVLSVELYDNDTMALVTLDTVFAAGEVYSISLEGETETKTGNLVVDTFFMLQIAPEAESAAIIYDQPMNAAGASASTNPFIVVSDGVSYSDANTGASISAGNLNPGSNLEGSVVYTFPGEVLELAYVGRFHGDGLTTESADRDFKCQISADGETWTDLSMSKAWLNADNPTRTFAGNHISLTAVNTDYTSETWSNMILYTKTLGETEAGTKYIKIIYPVGVSGVSANNRNFFDLKVAYTAPTAAEEVTTKIESGSEAAYIMDDGITVQYSANVTKNGMGAVIVAVAYDINGNVLGMKVGSQLSTGANTVKLDIKVDDAYSATSVKAFYFESLGDIEPLRIPVEIATE